ncbi:ferritin [Methanoplanus limicola]|jgi:ferritin|uniref:Ferritin Dps family protein n=1 Tax=Methanoplanus limicola DSM 2279 TaxID=937775 RepID=H1YWL5_9EURY|nr:ferritin [Methanoplanus limicola]EHQ35817.1 Ferritin Dps family protein [Methanoplanus limicola DSM 2279]
MAMNPKIEKELNEQIMWELYSSYMYLSMSSWYESIGLKGFANWESVQAQEELEHAMKFYSYMISRGGRVKLQAIKEPPTEWASPLDAFEASLEHEKFVTSRINLLVELAIEERDHPTNNMLQWYVDEQVEEEANAEEILNQLRLMGSQGNSSLLYMLDKELATRVYTPPATDKKN